MSRGDIHEYNRAMSASGAPLHRKLPTRHSTLNHQHIKTCDLRHGALAQSGAIVLYACNKAGRHIPTDEATHTTAMQWCMQAATDIGGASAGLQQVAVVAPEKVQSTVDLFEQRFIRAAHR